MSRACVFFVFKTNAVIGLSMLDCMIVYIWRIGRQYYILGVCMCGQVEAVHIQTCGWIFLICGLSGFFPLIGGFISTLAFSRFFSSPGSHATLLILILKLNTHTVLLNSLCSKSRFCYNVSFLIIQSYNLIRKYTSYTQIYILYANTHLIRKYTSLTIYIPNLKATFLFLIISFIFFDCVCSFRFFFLKYSLKKHKIKVKLKFNSVLGIF